MSHLNHYGTPRHSGRYPWGSGKNPQRSKNFYGKIRDLEKRGLTQTEIAKAMGMKSTTELRAKKQIYRNDVVKEKTIQVFKLREQGYSKSEIGRRLGWSEGQVRKLLKEGEPKKNKLDSIVDTVKREVDKKKYLDVGKNVEAEIGTSKESLRTAVEILKNQGYTTHEIKVPQATNPTQRTTYKVLTKDDVTRSDVWEHRDEIQSVASKELRDDVSNLNMRPPVNLDSSRIAIRYAEDGGIHKDGVIEIRQGVSDLTLPNGRTYAQCRIGVDGTHYLKGMAVYSDDFKGYEKYDIIFNTNKSKDTPKMDVLKEQKLDKDNVFGATVRQYGQDPDTGEWSLLNGSEAQSKKLKQSPINVVNEDSDWEKWSKNLSSQFLSKQYPAVAKEQLKLAYDKRKNEYDQICDLTNPTVKKKLLADFADSCDSDAVDLKAAAFPRQSTHVILPLTKIGDKEIYAPNFDNGEQVMLVRYPHAGPFESPVLTVNNNNAQGKKLLGQAPKAVGINSTVAEQLSGADFDGDTVTVIPMRGQQLKYSKPLKALEGFDPKLVYKKLPGDPVTGEDDKFNKQREMGSVSNLITDMTIRRASPDEIARAVKHSMCVIDAEKHNLDWKKSEEENGIKELKELYQGGANRGASTLISKASSVEHLKFKRTEGVTVIDPETGKKSRQYIDPETGKKLYTEKVVSYQKLNKDTGKMETKYETTKSTKMAEADDAYELISPDRTRVEQVYADHANRLKALANQSRLEELRTGDIEYSRTAAKKYAPEVEELNAALRIAELKAPQERRANAIADVVVKSKIEANPDLEADKSELKRTRAQAIASARARLGLQRYDIPISDRQWEAIQAGAISKSKLERILRRADGNRVRELATPKKERKLSASTQSQIRSMLRRGYTQAEIAKEFGISSATVASYAK